MRTALAVLLSSPYIAPLLHLAHVEALLLLPRNKRIRKRSKLLYQVYSRAHFKHTDPYADDDADSHPDVIAALRPILAIEAMLTDGRHQGALADYREALLRGQLDRAEWIERNLADIVEPRTDRRADGTPHTVG